MGSQQVTIIDKVGGNATVTVDQDQVAATLRGWILTEDSFPNTGAMIDELQRRLDAGHDVKDPAQFLGIKIL